MQSSSFTDSLLSFFLEQQGSKTQVSVCLVKLLKLLILIYTSALKLSTPYTEHCMFLRIPINSHVFFCHKKMNIFFILKRIQFSYFCAVPIHSQNWKMIFQYEAISKRFFLVLYILKMCIKF